MTLLFIDGSKYSISLLLCSAGKRGHLLSQPVAQGDELSKFLDSDNMKYLSWLHEIKRGNYLAVSRYLHFWLSVFHIFTIVLIEVMFFISVQVLGQAKSGMQLPR